MIQLMNRILEIFNKNSDFKMEWDGEGDNRLFYQDYPYLETLKLTKEEYEEFENILNNTEIVTHNYIIYAGYDVSGYDYWKESEENNYAMPTILVNNQSMGISQIKQMIKDFDNFMYELEDKLNIIGLTMYLDEGF